MTATLHDASSYPPEHGDRLRRRLLDPDWRAVLESGLLDETRRDRVPPGTTRDFIATVVDPLLAANGEAVRRRIAAGDSDRQALVDALGRWPDGLAGGNPKLSFLGLTLTYGCNFDPRCSYCTQVWSEPAVDLTGWKRVVASATAANDCEGGPYVYLTGGEVLTLEKDLWGDEGLIAFASRRGAAVNLNTNASLITPEIAVRLLKVGTAKLHISLDTPNAAVQDELWGEPGRCAAVLRGIGDLQIARDLLGVEGPEIHINCVLTRHNLDAVGDLWTFLVDRKKRVPKGHPLYYDLLPHIIPVGGDANDDLRPAAAEFERFYGPVWERVEAVWHGWQAEAGVEEKDRGPLFGPFHNPFQRVEHGGNLSSYAAKSAAGHYGDLALSRACYVAPTQASITPDGLQFRCGAHAVRRHEAIGSVAGDTGADALIEHMRAGIDGLRDLPRPEACHNCALATVYINQSVEHRLGETVDTWLQETPTC